jgi:hypothetical protein
VDFRFSGDCPGKADLVRQEVVKQVHYDLLMPGVVKDLGSGFWEFVENEVEFPTMLTEALGCCI